MCELAVVTVRGERRPTSTGFPVIERRAEATRFFQLAHHYMPDLGFDVCNKKLHESDDPVDVEEPEIAAPFAIPALRALARFRLQIACFSDIDIAALCAKEGAAPSPF